MKGPKLPRAGWMSTCTACGKRCYTTRRLAKQAARDGDPSCRASVYRCGNAWHWGHLPAAVRRGYIDRSVL